MTTRLFFCYSILCLRYWNSPVFLKYDLPTAKRALNNLHFFLSYLWFPWDEASEEDDGGKTGWVEQHLENRLEIVRSFLENG